LNALLLIASTLSVFLGYTVTTVTLLYNTTVRPDDTINVHLFTGLEYFSLRPSFFGASCELNELTTGQFRFRS